MNARVPLKFITGVTRWQEGSGLPFSPCNDPFSGDESRCGSWVYYGNTSKRFHTYFSPFNFLETVTLLYHKIYPLFDIFNLQRSASSFTPPVFFVVVFDDGEAGNAPPPHAAVLHTCDCGTF